MGNFPEMYNDRLTWGAGNDTFKCNGRVSRNNPRSLCELNRSSLLLVPKVVNYGRSPIENCFIFMSLFLIYQLIYSS